MGRPNRAKGLRGIALRDCMLEDLAQAWDINMRALLNSAHPNQIAGNTRSLCLVAKQISDMSGFSTLPSTPGEVAEGVRRLEEAVGEALRLGKGEE